MTQDLAMDADQIVAFLGRHFPQALATGAKIVRVDGGGVELQLETGEHHLRPGGTVAGPTLMTLADSSMYLTLLSRLGVEGAARSVTTSLEMHFLGRPRPGRLVCACRLLKLGRRLAVGSADIRADGGERLLAHATVTYALPDG